MHKPWQRGAAEALHRMPAPEGLLVQLPGRPALAGRSSVRAVEGERTSRMQQASRQLVRRLHNTTNREERKVSFSAPYGRVMMRSCKAGCVRWTAGTRHLQHGLPHALRRALRRLCLASCRARQRVHGRLHACLGQGRRTCSTLYRMRLPMMPPTQTTMWPALLRAGGGSAMPGCTWPVWLRSCIQSTAACCSPPAWSEDRGCLGCRLSPAGPDQAAVQGRGHGQRQDCVRCCRWQGHPRICLLGLPTGCPAMCSLREGFAGLPAELGAKKVGQQASPSLCSTARPLQPIRSLISSKAWRRLDGPGRSLHAHPGHRGAPDPGLAAGAAVRARREPAPAAAGKLCRATLLEAPPACKPGQAPGRLCPQAPVALVAAFGVYAVGAVGLGVARFPSRPEEADALRRVGALCLWPVKRAAAGLPMHRRRCFAGHR